MIPIQKIFYFLLIFNGLAILAFYGNSLGSDSSTSQFKLDSAQDLYVQKESSKKSALRGADDTLEEAQESLDRITKILRQVEKELEDLKNGKIETSKKSKSSKSDRTDDDDDNDDDAIAQIKKILSKAQSVKTPFRNLVPQDEQGTFARKANPFRILGAYPKPQIRIPHTNKTEPTRYHKVHYAIFNDDDYCERVDYYNLAFPDNVFQKKNFFTDYARDTVPRQVVMPKIGRIRMSQFSKYGLNSNATERKYHLKTDINSFFTNGDGFHKYHEIGQNFLCATQIYNRIPGTRGLIRKDELVASIDQYATKFAKKPQCFKKDMFFPFAYRLYLESECTQFFDLINSRKYIRSLENEPIQYIIKVSHGSHSANGVFLLDANQTASLNEEYENGDLCGKNDRPLIAQKYITDPLLLDLDNKFDFRVYMLIASTNPLIVYYHDGFLRASLSSYEKHSTERGKHLTNTHLAESIFKEARDKKINGMTEAELREYHIWSFDELEDYLLESGKVTDKNWLEKHLRPQFKKAMIHLVKMSSDSFWKGSNVYGLFGLDFMLDKDFNLWFIEGNPNPQLINTSPFLGSLLKSLLRSLFDIEHSLYKSRMKRVFKVISDLRKAQRNEEDIDIKEWKAKYAEASFNRFEPEYRPNKKTNSFTLVMNEGLPVEKAYRGNLEPECANP